MPKEPFDRNKTYKPISEIGQRDLSNMTAEEMIEAAVIEETLIKGAITCSSKQDPTIPINPREPYENLGGKEPREEGFSIPKRR